MRKIKVTIVFLLSFMFLIGMSHAVFADSYPPVNGGTYTFDGNTITDSAGPSIEEQINGLEPGDNLTITFEYVNDSSDTTYWYLENEIIETLENDANTTGGGYTYRLTDGDDVVIFDSEAYGGEEAPAGLDDVGLKGVTNAVDPDDPWIFIRELGAHDSGETTLYVALDGESQVNSYEDKEGTLQVNYAVEKQPPGEDKVIYKPGTTTKTGDTFNPLFAILALTAALLAMLLAVLSYLKDRKDGEEA